MKSFLKYRTGTSPVENGVPVWLSEPDDEAWKPYDAVPFTIKYTDMWFSLKLPDPMPQDPALCFTLKARGFEIYLDDQVVLDSQSASNQQNGFYKPFYMMRLPEDSQGKTVYFKLDIAYKDIRGSLYDVLLGTQSDILSYNADAQHHYSTYLFGRYALASLFLFTGSILILAFFLVRKRQKSFLHLGFSSLCMGLWIVSLYLPD